jgi:hypothetical protein
VGLGGKDKYRQSRAIAGLQPGPYPSQMTARRMATRNAKELDADVRLESFNRSVTPVANDHTRKPQAGLHP